MKLTLEHLRARVTDKRTADQRAAANKLRAAAKKVLDLDIDPVDGAYDFGGVVFERDFTYAFFSSSGHESLDLKGWWACPVGHKHESSISSWYDVERLLQQREAPCSRCAAEARARANEHACCAPPEDLPS